MEKQKHIHFIGICGVAMSALATLWHKKGFKVTGSDKGFYPPVSTHLKNHNIEFYPGWHVEKMGKPDLVVVGNVAGSTNPELAYVLENDIPHFSYPELISKYLVKENSIVCAGTYGKTSTTSLLAWILKYADFNPAYMFGGLSLNLDTSADDLGGKYSVLEGDEYKTSRDNLKAKFFSYKPTHLLLTSIEWDHADIYETEKAYLEAFEKLVDMIPENGKIVACIDDENVKEVTKAKKEILTTYGKDENADYIYSDVSLDKEGLKFTVKTKTNQYDVKASLLGEYMAENICGAFAMACEIGIEPEVAIKAISEFKGLKRRLEKRCTLNGCDIYDDIAHSPAKAKYTLENLKKIYDGKIYAIFEPNTGNRQKEIMASYDNAFKSCDEVIIPRLTKIKIDETKELPLDGKDLTNVISKTKKEIKYIDDDEKLISYLKEKIQPGCAVVFLGSHGFRGMIESICD